MHFARFRSAFASKNVLGSALLSFAAVACGASPDPTSAPLSTSGSAVIKGTASDESQNAVVLLVMIDRGQGGIGQCTGTMLAPNLVLTARHCVSNTQEGIACKADGSPIAGGKITSDRKAEDIYVITGTQRPSQPKANGQGAKIIVNDATNLCNNDVALVLLKEPIKDTPIGRLRLDAPAVKGELITSIGWGVTDKTQSPTTRQQRTGIPVAAVGGDANEQTGPNEFAVGESICSGDSGGPAVAESTGTIIGVVSRGGNGTAPTNNPATSCTGPNASNVYSGLAGHKEMILAAYAEAGFDPWLEDGADPRLSKDGEACTDATACRSNACIQQKCTPSCAKDPCATGTTCQDSAGAKVCLPGAAPGAPGETTTTTTGCSASAGASFDGAALFGALGVASLLVSRRRRRVG